jgi:hypothetical protein
MQKKREPCSAMKSGSHGQAKVLCAGMQFSALEHRCRQAGICTACPLQLHRSGGSTRSKRNRPPAGYKHVFTQDVISFPCVTHFDIHVKVLGFDDFVRELELWRGTQAHTRIDYLTSSSLG